MNQLRGQARVYSGSPDLKFKCALRPHTAQYAGRPSIFRHLQCWPGIHRLHRRPAAAQLSMAQSLPVLQCRLAFKGSNYQSIEALIRIYVFFMRLWAEGCAAPMFLAFGDQSSLQGLS
jgi:hypothetical protein